jgi:hypothetical protein
VTVVAACFVRASSAHAAAALAVDLSATYRTATHVGNGSSYGVVEKIPTDSDLERLLGALHPRMLTNPASSDPGTQQPGVAANAIKVAARVAPLGASVTVRLSDWFSGWYTFTSMTDWLNKVGTTISAKKAANLSNVYAYEVWNEPNGSWTNGGDTNAVPGGTKTLSFNDFWKQTYDNIRQLDPGVKITGPSISYMDPMFINGFLTYCKANNCLPDIIGWHEGTTIEADVATYRRLEKQLGVGPLPITINEYSGSGRSSDEGRPGASIPLIAQLERSGVDTACISWWTPDSIAGHLGSLLATDSQTNGGWFVYKWYGDMTGGMVGTTSSLTKDGKNLDGIASLDTTAHNAYVILGGITDGSVQVVIKGFKSAAFPGNTVHAVVDHARWAGRGGVVASSDTLLAADLAIANDQITVSISNVNVDDGYRISLSQAGVFLDGGTGSDAAVDAGSISLDVGKPNRDAAGVPLDVRPNAGGAIGSGGSATGPMGGSPGLGSGATASGGARAGTAGGGGNTATSMGGAGGISTGPNGRSSGCSCSTQGRRQTKAGEFWLLLGFLAFGRRRKVAIRSFFSGIASFATGAKHRRILRTKDGPSRPSNER